MKKSKKSTISAKDFYKVLEKILKAEPVYIKDSGIRVVVKNFWVDNSDAYIRRNRNKVCEIEFIDIPTLKVVNMCESYTVTKKEYPPTALGAPGPTNLVETEAKIKIDNLRAIPFQSKTSKLLYQKDK